MFSELSRKFNISLYPNLMAPVIENENELSNYLQEDMLHPNEKGRNYSTGHTTNVY